VILLDCGQSWIYPAGDEPGAYALPPDAEPPPGAVLEVRARHADGDPFYDVYCVEGEGLVLEQPAEGATLDGPLAFLGYRVDATGAQPGGIVERSCLAQCRD